MNVAKGVKGFRSRPLTECFLEKISPEPNTGCWLWTGAGDGDRYGQIWSSGSKRKAHVVSWEIANGRRVPTGLLVLHSCDVPSCVNPAHLSVGTQGDNMQDAIRRGRRAKPPGYSGRTACAAGHPYSPGSYYVRYGYRVCKRCYLARSAKYRQAARDSRTAQSIIDEVTHE